MACILPALVTGILGIVMDRRKWLAILATCLAAVLILLPFVMIAILAVAKPY